jgi:hypothetical protein
MFSSHNPIGYQKFQKLSNDHLKDLIEELDKFPDFVIVNNKTVGSLVMEMQKELERRKNVVV